MYWGSNSPTKAFSFTKRSGYTIDRRQSQGGSMKTLIATLALLFISISCFAEITIDDLPHIEGTPLVERVDDIPVWSVLDYAEEDGIVQWAWLDNLGQLAYLAYPSNTDAQIFPDGFELNKSSEDIVISLRAAESLDWHFTRFGGEVVIRGNDVDVSYQPELEEEITQGNTYQLHDTRTLNLSGNAKALFFASGQILAIAGTESDDTLRGPNAENTWTLLGNSSGTLETGGEYRTTIEYSSIESLVGGDMDDTFEFSILDPGAISIFGGEGMNSIYFNGNSSGGSNVGDSSPGNGSSGLIIGSGPDFPDAEPIGPDWMISIPGDLNLPVLEPGEMTICRLPEPHEYTGEKKVLCGDEWRDVPDEIWTGMIAYSGASYLEEDPQEENPPKKKKSKGGSIPFSILHLLLLVLISQRWSNRRLPH
jgi:hypothetical protein